jgi:hypothetical protein
MKNLLLTAIAAVVLVGCGGSQQSVPSPEAQPAELVAEAATPEPPPSDAFVFLDENEGTIDDGHSESWNLQQVSFFQV